MISPVRKFARVGRGSSRLASRALTSASRRLTLRACLVAPASSRLAWARCHASGLGTSVSRSSACSSTVVHPSAGCGPDSRARVEPSRSMYSANRPARSASVLSTSSSGKITPSHARSDSSEVTPSRIRSRAVLNMFCRTVAIPNCCRCASNNPHRAPATAAQRRRVSWFSLVKQNCRATGAFAARSRTSLAVTRPSARRSRPATVSSSGLVRPRLRSASRTLSRCPGCSAPCCPNAAEIKRREHLDVGTHHDNVARLERVVVLKQMQDRFAENLDLPGRAVAGVDADTVVGRDAFVRPGPAFVTDVVLQFRENGACRVAGGVVNGLGCRGQSLLQFADVSGQAHQQRVGHKQRCVVIGPACGRRPPG